MNQMPSRPRRPVQQMPPAQRPQQTPPKKRRRKLRPAAIAILIIMALLLCAIVFGITYLITYNATYQAELEAMKEQLEAGTDESVSDVGGADEPEDVVSKPVTGENDETADPDEPVSNENDTPSTDTPSADEPSGNTQQNAEPNQGGSTMPAPKPTGKFADIPSIVSYVDSLGINFKELKSFDMSGYFADAMLKPTADAGAAYQNETVYIGDSLVLHMGSRSTHPKNMVYGAASINPEDACVKKLTTLKNGTEATFAEAMAELQPKRIVISIGTNSMWMEPTVYLQFFSRFIDQLKAACPKAEIILQSTPPLTAEYEAGKNFPTNEKINRFNMYLAGLAVYQDVYFLNSAPGLKNASGTLDAKYDSDGFHISAEGYDVWTNALRTHATTLQK